MDKFFCKDGVFILKGNIEIRVIWEKYFDDFFNYKVVIDRSVFDMILNNFFVLILFLEEVSIIIKVIKNIKVVGFEEIVKLRFINWMV